MNLFNLVYHHCLWQWWQNHCLTLLKDFELASHRVVSRLWSYVLTLATWLILPVVIRSSQRLSHACLSINILLWNCERLIISVIVYLIVPYYLDTRSNSRANTCVNTRPLEEWYLLDWNQPVSAVSWWFIITFRIALQHFIQVSALSALMVVYWTTMALTGNGGLGFDSGEGAWETATTSKEGSRRANYPILTQGGSDNK